jgi:uncharacterized protein (UPF0276 family)
VSGSKLGIGLLLNPALPQFLETHPESIDYLELIPDREWEDRGVHATPRYSTLAKSLEFLDRIRAHKPLLCHSIGLSIGSAKIFDTGHIDQIRWMHEQFDFAWHSDHLSFSRLPDVAEAGNRGREMHTAISLPVPYDEDVLSLIAGRVRYVRSVVGCPFLLENNVYYVETPEQQMSEPEFLNRLSREAGCGILLDLHNLYVNARNHGVSPEGFLRDLDLRQVVEIHLAGGDELLGFYTDSHAGPVAPPVWDLLRETLRAAPGVRAVTFEFHESSYPLLKMDGIRLELARARRIWEQYN